MSSTIFPVFSYVVLPPPPAGNALSKVLLCRPIGWQPVVGLRIEKDHTHARPHREIKGLKVKPLFEKLWLTNCVTHNTDVIVN